MFEFLIEDWTGVDPVEGTPKYSVVDLGGLLDEFETAMNDDDYCIAIYEIHRRRFDWTIPREEGEDCRG